MSTPASAPAPAAARAPPSGPQHQLPFVSSHSRLSALLNTGTCSRALLTDLESAILTPASLCEVFSLPSAPTDAASASPAAAAAAAAAATAAASTAPVHPEDLDDDENDDALGLAFDRGFHSFLSALTDDSPPLAASSVAPPLAALPPSLPLSLAELARRRAPACSTPAPSSSVHAPTVRERVLYSSAASLRLPNLSYLAEVSVPTVRALHPADGSDCVAAPTPWLAHVVALRSAHLAARGPEPLPPEPTRDQMIQALAVAISAAPLQPVSAPALMPAAGDVGAGNDSSASATAAATAGATADSSTDADAAGNNAGAGSTNAEPAPSPSPSPSPPPPSAPAVPTSVPSSGAAAHLALSLPAMAYWGAQAQALNATLPRRAFPLPHPPVVAAAVARAEASLARAASSTSSAAAAAAAGIPSLGSSAHGAALDAAAVRASLRRGPAPDVALFDVEYAARKRKAVADGELAPPGSAPVDAAVVVTTAALYVFPPPVVIDGRPFVVYEPHWRVPLSCLSAIELPFDRPSPGVFAPDAAAAAAATVDAAAAQALGGGVSPDEDTGGSFAGAGDDDDGGGASSSDGGGSGSGELAIRGETVFIHATVPLSAAAATAATAPTSSLYTAAADARATAGRLSPLLRPSAAGASSAAASSASVASLLAGLAQFGHHGYLQYALAPLAPSPAAAVAAADPAAPLPGPLEPFCFLSLVLEPPRGRRSALAEALCTGYAAAAGAALPAHHVGTVPALRSLLLHATGNTLARAARDKVGAVAGTPLPLPPPLPTALLGPGQGALSPMASSSSSSSSSSAATAASAAAAAAAGGRALLAAASAAPAHGAWAVALQRRVPDAVWTAAAHRTHAGDSHVADAGTDALVEVFRAVAADLAGCTGSNASESPATASVAAAAPGCYHPFLSLLAPSAGLPTGAGAGAALATEPSISADSDAGADADGDSDADVDAEAEVASPAGAATAGLRRCLLPAIAAATAQLRPAPPPPTVGNASSSGRPSIGGLGSLTSPPGGVRQASAAAPGPAAREQRRQQRRQASALASALAPLLPLPHVLPRLPPAVAAALTHCPCGSGSDLDSSSGASSTCALARALWLARAHARHPSEDSSLPAVTLSAAALVGGRAWIELDDSPEALDALETAFPLGTLADAGCDSAPSRHGHGSHGGHSGRPGEQRGEQDGKPGAGGLCRWTRARLAALLATETHEDGMLLLEDVAAETAAEAAAAATTSADPSAASAPAPEPSASRIAVLSSALSSAAGAITGRRASVSRSGSRSVSVRRPSYSAAAASAAAVAAGLADHIDLLRVLLEVSVAGAHRALALSVLDPASRAAAGGAAGVAGAGAGAHVVPPLSPPALSLAASLSLTLPSPAVLSPPSVDANAGASASPSGRSEEADVLSPLPSAHTALTVTGRASASLSAATPLSLAAMLLSSGSGGAAAAAAMTAAAAAAAGTGFSGSGFEDEPGHRCGCAGASLSVPLAWGRAALPRRTLASAVSIGGSHTSLAPPAAAAAAGVSAARDAAASCGGEYAGVGTGVPNGDALAECTAVADVYQHGLYGLLLEALQETQPHAAKAYALSPAAAAAAAASVAAALGPDAAVAGWTAVCEDSVPRVFPTPAHARLFAHVGALPTVPAHTLPVQGALLLPLPPALAPTPAPAPAVSSPLAHLQSPNGGAPGAGAPGAGASLLSALRARDPASLRALPSALWRLEQTLLALALAADDAAPSAAVAATTTGAPPLLLSVLRTALTAAVARCAAVAAPALVRAADCTTAWVVPSHGRTHAPPLAGSSAPAAVGAWSDSWAPPVLAVLTLAPPTVSPAWAEAPVLAVPLTPAAGAGATPVAASITVTPAAAVTAARAVAMPPPGTASVSAAEGVASLLAAPAGGDGAGVGAFSAGARAMRRASYLATAAAHAMTPFSKSTFSGGAHAHTSMHAHAARADAAGARGCAKPERPRRPSALTRSTTMPPPSLPARARPSLLADATHALAAQEAAAQAAGAEQHASELRGSVSAFDEKQSGASAEEAPEINSDPAAATPAAGDAGPTSPRRPPRPSLTGTRAPATPTHQQQVVRQLQHQRDVLKVQGVVVSMGGDGVSAAPSAIAYGLPAAARRIAEAPALAWRAALITKKL